MIHNCRVVLVRTEVAGNLGAAARVMRNMGLSQLTLVAPVADINDRQARQLSTHGESILDGARTVATLAEALADCGLVVGTSARVGGPFRRQSVGTPAEIMPRVVAALQTMPAALVFGPEPSGLTDGEVSRCHHLIHIPVDDGYPALNLAQAVAICLYELRQTWLRGQDRGAEREAAASFETQERMFASLREALEDVHFIYGQSADSLWHALRHLLGRAQPTDMEVGVLHGLARQIRWYVEKHPEKKTGE
jgi:TrmH family RNA methyltransferase